MRNACLVWALVVSGCSWLVDAEGLQPRCLRADGGPEVCPSGQQCREGRCQPLCGTEVCGDGEDNDCDGVVDEVDPLAPDICGDGEDNDCDGQIDEGSDQDGDGYAWCGNTRDPASGKRSLDCDDYNAAVNPSAAEICDGLDNDCDGVIDSDSSALCPQSEMCIEQRCVAPSCAIEHSGITCKSGERCEPVEQRCVASSSCDNVSCAANEYCDASSNTCRMRDPGPNGSPCIADKDCQSGMCVDGAALRLSNAPRVCAKACCDDAQCGPDERCFASGTGARSCLPKSMLAASVLSQCTTDAPCAAPAICALDKNQALPSSSFQKRSSLTTSACRADGVVGHGLGDRCLSYASCDSRICVPGAGFGLVCSMPCGQSQDCAEFSGAAASSYASAPKPKAYCRYIPVSLDQSLVPPDYASVCVVDNGGETGKGGYGSPCSAPEDCADRGCVGASVTSKGRCTPMCCDDTQCGFDPLTERRLVCRPFAFGARYEMRCGL